jgi:hypothetical protein
MIFFSIKKFFKIMSGEMDKVNIGDIKKRYDSLAKKNKFSKIKINLY